MSVTSPHTIRAAGNEIVSPNYSNSLWEKSAILSNRSKPAPALFSRKALNLEYIDSTFKKSQKLGELDTLRSTAADYSIEAAINTKQRKSQSMTKVALSIPRKQGK